MDQVLVQNFKKAMATLILSVHKLVRSLTKVVKIRPMRHEKLKVRVDAENK